MKEMTFVQAVNEALHLSMERDQNVICYGLGVTDPKEIFGTTDGLLKKYGSERVFDMPTSENGMTGVAIGAALNGIRSVMVHQRLDFFLLAMDQVVNNAAKWFYMFGGQRSVPITIRLIIGHGWGQGPTHCQNLQSWFAHVPGLKVVMPTTPADAKGMLLASIADENPVIFLEHRWLHQQKGMVPEGYYETPIEKAKVVTSGTDVTIVSLSYMTVEAIHAIEFLKHQGISCELIDLRSVQPIDWETIFTSVKKTGRLVALDTAQETLSVASEIVARVSQDLFSFLKSGPVRIGQPDVPSPTSFGLSKGYYRRSEAIALAIGRMMKGHDLEISALTESRKFPHDVPGDWFKGPF